MVATSDIDIYVHSAGYGLRHDFRWAGASTDAHAAAVSRELDRLLDLAYSQSVTSLCIERKAGRLWLIACNLASARTDFLGRPIANTFALRGVDTPDVERVVRGIAARILTDTAGFASALDTAITAGEDHAPAGWEVDRDAVTALVRPGEPGGDESGRVDPSARYEARSADSSRRLAGELSQSPLPGRAGVLVLVSPHHSDEMLAKRNVWRGLTGAGPEPESAAMPAPDPEPEADEPAPSVTGEAGRREMPTAPKAAAQPAPEPARSDVAGDVILACGITVLFGLVIAAFVGRSR